MECGDDRMLPSHPRSMSNMKSMMRGRCLQCGERHAPMEPCCCPMCCQPLRANHECGTCAICNQDHPGDQCLDSTIIGRCRGCGQKHAGNACPCPRCLAFHHGDNCYPLFTTGGNHHIVEAFTSTTGFCGLCATISSH